MLGKKPLPTKEQVIEDTVDSIAARYNLRYSEQKLLHATAALASNDPTAFEAFDHKRYAEIFNRSQFRKLGGARR